MAGVYVHIPFCKQKCTYCDFHFSTSFENYRQKMIDAMVSEIESQVDYLVGKEVNTIYFGGGTPSLLTRIELHRIMDSISKNFTIPHDAEISLEANPDDIDAQTLEDWKSVGVNRLSVGLQSFKQEDLDWMNRAHSRDEALVCIDLIQSAGIENITVDLMYGLPNLSIDEWKSHVQTVIGFNIPHISAYCLTIEDKTALETMVRRGKVVPANEDQQSEQFELLVELLLENGFEHYEISNFGKKGFESKHNSNYWKGEWYLGIGPSAHSFNGISRSWNIANNKQYIKAIEKGQEFSELEVLTKEDRFNEYVLTGLRTSSGLSLERLQSISDVPSEFHTNCEDFMAKNGCNQGREF